MTAINKAMMMRGLLLRQSKAKAQLQTVPKAGFRGSFLATMPHQQLQEFEPAVHVHSPPSSPDFRSSYAWQSPQFKYPKKQPNRRTQQAEEIVTAEPAANQESILSFEVFVESIPEIIRMRQKTLRTNPKAFDGKLEDPVIALFRYVV